jgi:hypothetical protein
MGRTRSRSTHRRRRSRRRLALSVVLSALLLLLLLAPIVSRWSLFGTRDDQTSAVASEQVSDEAGGGLIVSRSAATSPGAFVSLAPSANRAHDRMESAGVLVANGATRLEQEAFETWLALQPFRVQSDRGSDTRWAPGGPAGSPNNFPSLIVPPFATLPTGAGGSLGAAGAALTSPVRSFDSGDDTSSGLPAGTPEDDRDDTTALPGVGDRPTSPGTIGTSDGGSAPHESRAEKPRPNGNGATWPGGPETAGSHDEDVAFVPASDTGGPDDGSVSAIVIDESLTPPIPAGITLANDDVSVNPAAVPEPAGLILLGSGLVIAARRLKTRGQVANGSGSHSLPARRVWSLHESTPESPRHADQPRADQHE